ncbi:MAG: hypothetical protein E7318_05335 [Clostridiales bacterium]|nr:hypothetical protein [Clostridiales bacterium]
MSQHASRMAGENCARLMLLRLLCAVSIWRTAVTRVLPLCGVSAWWVTLVCLLPGFAAAALLRYVMHLTQTSTLTEAVRACLGKVGAWAISAVLAAILLVEGLSGLTALITLFTQGVGTRGTPFTMALLTGGALLLSLHRDGLPRAAHFLRGGMAAAAVLIAACLVPSARLDNLFPLHGWGNASVLTALKAGISLAWPVALLLTVPHARPGRLRSAVLPVFASVAGLLLLTLTIPQELVSRQTSLAALLLLPTKYAANALRVLYLCLLILTTFLSIGASVQLATVHLCAPLKYRPTWLPHALLIGLILTQTGDAAHLWRLLMAVQPWLLAPLMEIAFICVPTAFIRRKKT